MGLLAIVAALAVVLTLAAQDDARAQSFTSLQFTNSSSSQVTAWLTLGADSAGTVEGVILVDTSTTQHVPITGSGLQGHFTLNPHQSVTWNSFNGGRASGSITFRAPPQSCPIDGGPCGVTKGEFAINLGNEAVDISSVDGINAIMSMDLSDGGAVPWPSAPDGSRVAQNSGTLTGDKALWGVFPYRCSICAAIGNAPDAACNPLGPANQSYCKDGTESDPHPAKCQLNRTGAGGTVKFGFISVMDPPHSEAPPAAPQPPTGPAPAPAVTTPSTVVTPSAGNTPITVITPSMAVTPSPVVTAQRPPTSPVGVPTAQPQPTMVAPMPTAVRP